MNDAPKLLVEWSSPWEEFLTAIRPALARSPKALAGEARTGLFPYRGIIVSWVLEVALLVAAVVIPAKLATLRPYAPPVIPKYDVIYYSGDELPRTEDNGGARSGRSGRAGGQEAHHRTQTIRVARGESLREKVVDAPRLKLPRSDSAVANLLAFKPVPGTAPAEGLKPSTRNLGNLSSPIAPAPEVQQQHTRSMPAVNAMVVPPSPSAPKTDITRTPLPGSQVVSIVPPTVSAPEQITNLPAKLTLPAAAVIAPAPTEAARSLHSVGPGFGPGELQKQIVPPPVQVGSAADGHRSISGVGNADVVPPPVQVNAASSGRRSTMAMNNPEVVAPPVQVGGAGGTGHARSLAALGGGGSTVVPPAPEISGGASGMGSGSRGSGLGGPLDTGSVAAPPTSTGGSTAGNGVVVSSQPGSKLGVPGNGGAGALAMSPSGGSKPGIGGSGGGSGIGRGSGPASGLSGEGSGASKEGTGRGSDLMAKGGTSPYPGTGGAGSGTTGKPAMPGVSVRGGSNIVTLPSFGADGSQPADVGRSSVAKGKEGPAITIVGTSRSGGAFNFYGTLKGDKVYTIYIDTALGTAVMEYADPASAVHPYADDLIAPLPMRADLPANLKLSRLVIACVLDRSGLVRNPQVLEAGNSELTSKVLASLPGWKFRPVFRGNQPVEVNAILGFGIDTR